MDFVTGLPISTDWKGTNYNLILVIVDRLTKMVYYEPVQITIHAPGLAEVILDFVARHHGLPDSIVSDTLPAIKFIHDIFHVLLLEQDTTKKGRVCENATRTLLICELPCFPGSWNDRVTTVVCKISLFPSVAVP